MSIKIMSAVFESETLGPTERLIMLALADHADDSGRCYPSMARLCQRTGLGERSIQNNLKALVAKGYVTIVPNAGPNGTNVFYVRTVAEPKPEIAAGGSARFPDAHGRFAIYRRDNHTCVYCGYLSPDGEQNLTLDHILPQSRGGGHEPENLVTACMDCNRKKKGRTPFEWLGDDCPPHLMPPARNAPRTKCAQTPAYNSKTPAPDAPKPSRTIIEPSDDISCAKPVDILASASSPKAAASFVAYRQKIRKPLTETAARRLAATLNQIANQGGCPNDALGMAEEKGWQSIKPEWYFKETANEQSPRPTRADANANALRYALDVAGRARPSPEPDWL